MNLFKKREAIKIWQFLFLLFGTTWLWAPYLNHNLSYRTALISQYELPGQPYSWLFRLCDILAACLLLAVVYKFINKISSKKVATTLLLVIAAGMLIDPIFSTSCHLKGGVCQEYVSTVFILHAIETVITSLAIFMLAAYDSWLRKRLVSICFMVFQILYSLLFMSQLATHAKFNTVSQMVYQSALIIWLSWFVRDFFFEESRSIKQKDKKEIVKKAFAVWAFLNGLMAIILSFSPLKLLGDLDVSGIYFAGNNAWLSQHGVIVGTVMLYLSRHLYRGERRARQIFLAITALEALNYSVISPHPLFLAIYLLTFILLFIERDSFNRGIIALTWKIRFKDAFFLIGGLSVAASASLIILYSSNHNARIANQSLDHFFDYTIGSRVVPKTHLQSVLLAHTFSAFIVVSLALVLWILFRPYPTKKSHMLSWQYEKAKDLLKKYSNSSEDYFKIWPKDKEFYFYDDQGFIAYKRAGPGVFALADPIAPSESQRHALLNDFLADARARRLRSCFLPISEDSLSLYKDAGLSTQQIGASAMINVDNFLQNTVRDKWWRWQINKAVKSGYIYEHRPAPHSHEFITQLKEVSDAWLATGGHQEQGFALGYFDADYLQDCDIHLIKNDEEDIIAFTNQLPVFGNSKTATVDLLRYKPECNKAMSYLLFMTIEKLEATTGLKHFDLGFVPFAASNDLILKVAQTLSAGRFSAKGLEQFKNKFDPVWLSNYMAYDGDIGDLALVIVNLEKVMKLE
jgi:lysylphosphatidylglycerol synthetase-like protein (DUF2156 family)